MITVPVATPVNTAEEEPMVAIDVLLLVQVPPEVTSPKVVDEPTHVLALPVIAVGPADMVITALPEIVVVPKGVVSLPRV